MKWFPPLLCAVLLCCAFTPVSGATKSEQVERYLGKYRFEHDRPVGIVKFIFQKAVLKRQGNGKLTYRQLLVGEPYYSNEDNAGKLIGIQVVNQGKTMTILPEAPDKPAPAPSKKAEPAPVKPKAQPKTKPQQQTAPTEPPTAGEEAGGGTGDDSAPVAPTTPTNDPVRPRTITGTKTVGGIVPDSVALAESLTNARHNVEAWKGQFWQTMRPIWSFVMWIFNSILVLLVCFGGLCRYVAKTAASESLINAYGRIIVGRWIVAAHQNAAAMLLVITWIIAIVLLIDVFMWLVFLDFPVWMLVVIWFPILWVAEKLTNFIVPNIPILGPGRDR